MSAFDGGREDWEERKAQANERGGTFVALLLALCCLAAVACGQTVPDPTLTPGLVATTDEAVVCARGTASYSYQHRQTGVALKAQVRRNYHATRCGEIDHLLPLSLGGADTVDNLWCQPGLPEVWNYKLKDKLEDRIWATVCHPKVGSKMTLAEAQSLFLGTEKGHPPDWRLTYCEYFPGPPCPVPGP